MRRENYFFAMRPKKRPFRYFPRGYGCCEHQRFPVSQRPYGELYRRINAYNRHTGAPRKIIFCFGGRGIARDNHRFAPFAQQSRVCRTGARPDIPGRSVSVRRVAAIVNVHEIFVRQNAAAGGKHAQPARSAVEYSYRRAFHTFFILRRTRACYGNIVFFRSAANANRRRTRLLRPLLSTRSLPP